MILLVVDTQKGCFNEELYMFEKVRKASIYLCRNIQTQSMIILTLIKKPLIVTSMTSCGISAMQM